MAVQWRVSQSCVSCVRHINVRCIDWDTCLMPRLPAIKAGRRGAVHGCWKACLPGSCAAGPALHPKVAGAPCTGAVLELGVTAWRSRAQPGDIWGRRTQAEAGCAGAWAQVRWRPHASVSGKDDGGEQLHTRFFRGNLHWFPLCDRFVCYCTRGKHHDSSVLVLTRRERGRGERRR